MSKQKLEGYSRKLKYISTINPSPTTSEIWNRDILVSFYPMESIPQPGQIKKVAVCRVLNEVIAGYTYFRNNDFVFAKVTPCFENGKAGLMRNLNNGLGFGSTELTVIRAKEGLSDIHFLGYVARSDRFKTLGESEMTGAGGLKRVPDQFVRDFVTYAPLVHEQRQIAVYLNRETAKMDKLIAKQQKLIKLLQEKRQAVISHAVTKGLDPNVKMKDSGVDWLGEMPEHWELVSLTRYLGKIVDYRGRTPTKSDSGVYLITARNIRKGFIDYDCSEEFILEEEYEDSMRRGKPEVGDLLFTMEAPLGNVAIVDRTDVAIAQRVVKFRSMTEFLNSEYLMYSILGTYFQSQLETLATGSTALGLKASKLNQLRILRPPINEQISISQAVEAHLTKLSVLDQKAHKQIALLKEHRQALITAAVTGKVDVRRLVTDEEVAALDAEPELETTEEDLTSEVLEDSYITEEE